MQKMSNADAAWSRMDSPMNLMMVTTVLMFDGPLDFAGFKAVIQKRMLAFNRFRQCVIHQNGTHYWQDAANFNIDDHLQRVRLPNPGGKAQLQALTSQLISTPLDFTKPLWQFTFVENYDSGFALISRMHHCIADGIALVRVLLSLTDLDPDAARPLMNRLNPQSASSLPAKAAQLIKMGAGVAGSAFKLAAMPPDSRTILRGNLGGEKLAAWSDPIPLESVKSAGRRLGVTINDIMLAAVTGSLRRYLLNHNALPDKVNTRVIIPVDLRPVEEEIKLGNRFALVFLALPLNTANPGDRLKAVQRRMNKIKQSQDAVTAFGILSLLGVVPGKLEEWGLKFFGAKGTAVVSNVPGPRQQISMGNNHLKHVMFWVPQAYSVSMGISLLSYAGQILLGVTTDTSLVKDPDAIVAGMQHEIDTLIALSEL